MIHVIATVTVKPGQREALLKLFSANVPSVKAEKGCIEYGAAVDVASGFPAQGALRDQVVVIVEKWESVDHLKAHMATPHMLAYRQKTKDMVEGVALQVLKPVTD